MGSSLLALSARQRAIVAPRTKLLTKGTSSKKPHESFADA
jgi:hypothetical protein